MQVSFSRSVSYLRLFSSFQLQHEFHIDVYQAAKDVSSAQDALRPLIDIFERIENFFKRLETYTEVPPTAAMTDIIVKIMVEVLNIFALATKEIRQGLTSKPPIRFLSIDSAHR